MSLNLVGYGKKVINPVLRGSRKTSSSYKIHKNSEMNFIRSESIISIEFQLSINCIFSV